MSLAEKLAHMRTHSRVYRAADAAVSIMLCLVFCVWSWRRGIRGVEEGSFLQIALCVTFAFCAFISGIIAVCKITGPLPAVKERGIRDVLAAKRDGATYPELIKVAKKYAPSDYWSRRLVSAALNTDSQNCD